MKRILTTIVCVLYVLTASAVSYGASYKGSNYSGRIYTTSSARSTSIGSGGGLASAPLASMGAIGSFGGHGKQITGLQTSASPVLSGVISGRPYIAAGDYNPPVPDDACDHCSWHWDPKAGDDGNGDWVCDDCGAWYSYGCECGEYCPCPIGDGWQVWLFMAVMAFAYAVFKKRHSLRSETI